MFTPPDIAYFSINGFPIYYYGVILALAIFFGIVVSNWIAIKEYYLCGAVPRVATSIIIGGIAGARLYYCLLNCDVYLSNPIEILALREGGLSIHGAIIGGVIALLYETKQYNYNFGKLCDIFAMGLPIGQAIGRWGNFFNSEAFGTPTDLPWKMYVKKSFRPDEYFSQEYFHPTFLYESLLDILIFIILYSFILKRYKENTGIISASYLILYSIVRFFIEGMRVDCVKYIWGIPFPQLVSIVIILCSIIFIIIKYNKLSDDKN